MDAAQALADLTEISSQIDAAVLFGEDGSVAASTLDDQERARTLAVTAAELLDAADELRGGAQGLTQLEASTLAGSVFVVRRTPWRIVATTPPDPTVGLVFYDLKSCLRALENEETAKPKKRTRKRKETADGA